MGQATPFDFVQEVQVKTGGYEAEFGQSMGGIVNVITKSGSNEVRGSGFAYFQPSAFEGEWRQFQTVNGSVNTTASQRNDAGVEGGFPDHREPSVCVRRDQSGMGESDLCGSGGISAREPR